MITLVIKCVVCVLLFKGNIIFDGVVFITATGFTVPFLSIMDHILSELTKTTLDINERHEKTRGQDDGKSSDQKSYQRRHQYSWRQEEGVEDFLRLPDEGRQKLHEDLLKEYESRQPEMSEGKTNDQTETQVALQDLDTFKDSHEYSKAMTTRVSLESEYDREVTKSRRIKGINIYEWKPNLNQMNDFVTAVFELPSLDIKISLCDKVVLSVMLPEDTKETFFDGEITKVPDRVSTSVEVQVQEPTEELTNQFRNFEMAFDFNSIPYDRMICGITQFHDMSTEVIGNTSELTSLFVASQVKKMIVGLESTPILLDSPRVAVPSIEGLPDLNDAQKEAVMHVLNNPLTLIQGPPGTGKTVTSAHIVHHLRQSTGSTVLVCAQSNIAVDNLMKVILKKKGMKVVRINSQVREKDRNNNPFGSLSLDYLIGKRCPKLKNFYRRIANMTRKELSEMFRLKDQIERQIMEEADVVCCTSSGAGDARVLRHKFLSSLIDECGQGTETDTLIPISLTYGRVVLVGDHKQLGPVVQCDDAKTAGMETSMFERLIKIGVPVLLLDTQYRMHPAISRFSNYNFYDGKLFDGVDESDRICNAFPWPRTNHPVMFYACNNGQEKKCGTSYRNIKEAKMLKEFVDHLLSNGVEGKNVGIICGYDAQKQYLIEMKIPVEVEINTVDGFQGREKEVIIMTCVRSNSVGFLRDPRRMNVSLTRAKSGLIIIGNAICLTTNSLWRKLLNHMEEEQVLVYGNLKKWLPIALQDLPNKNGQPTREQIRRRTQLLYKKDHANFKGRFNNNADEEEDNSPFQDVFATKSKLSDKKAIFVDFLYGF